MRGRIGCAVDGFDLSLRGNTTPSKSRSVQSGRLQAAWERRMPAARAAIIESTREALRDLAFVPVRQQLRRDEDGEVTPTRNFQALLELSRANASDPWDLLPAAFEAAWNDLEEQVPQMRQVWAH